MAVLIIRHSIRDYVAWRPVYDAHEAARTAAGLTKGCVFRCTEDPHDILIDNEMADRRRIEEFGRSDDLREAMRRASVARQPAIRFAD
jgi:hypothetical protein